MAIFKNQQRQNQFGRLRNIQNKIQSGNTNPNLQTRASNLTAKLQPVAQRRFDSGKLKEGQANKLNTTFGGNLNAQPQAPVPGTTAPDPTTATTAPASQDSGRWAEYMKALFPQVGNFNQTAQQVQESPYYSYQRQKGEDAIARYNSARGLTDSKFEQNAVMDFNKDLLGREVESLRDIQQREADRGQVSAGRFFNLLDSNANRQERGAQNQFQNQLNLFEAMARQSPLEYGYGAAGSLADMKSGLTKDQASFAAQNYARTPSPGYNAPFPTGPDFSGIDLMGALMQNQQSQSNNSNIWNTLGGLASAFV